MSGGAAAGGKVAAAGLCRPSDTQPREDREAEHQEGGVEVRRGTGARLKRSLAVSTARGGELYFPPEGEAAVSLTFPNVSLARFLIFSPSADGCCERKTLVFNCGKLFQKECQIKERRQEQYRSGMILIERRKKKANQLCKSWVF